METSPIAFFTYKRPEHTRQSLESLTQNEGAEQSELFIFCDGPKRPEDQEGVRQVREVVRSKQWCGNVLIVERESNMGCANSIISGVTEVCEKYGRVIVLEDDLVLSPFFLDYMNKALELYKDNHKDVKIGRGAIVAACSVVTKDVPEFVIVAGNPARIVKQINKADYKLDKKILI